MCRNLELGLRGFEADFTIALKESRFLTEELNLLTSWKVGMNREMHVFGVPGFDDESL